MQVHKRYGDGLDSNIIKQMIKHFRSNIYIINIKMMVTLGIGIRAICYLLVKHGNRPRVSKIEKRNSGCHYGFSF